MELYCRTKVDTINNNNNKLEPGFNSIKASKLYVSLFFAP